MKILKYGRYTVHKHAARMILEMRKKRRAEGRSRWDTNEVIAIDMIRAIGALPARHAAEQEAQQ